jgi:hypothetical protein
VEQFVGFDIQFECLIKANPLANHYWMKDGNVIENLRNPLMSDEDYQRFHPKITPMKYEINVYNEKRQQFLTVSQLLVKNITINDFGVYQCFAVNAHNTVKAEVELEGTFSRLNIDFFY